MSTPFGTPLLIANPAAGRGRDDVVARLRTALRGHGVDSDVAETSGSGDATRLAQRAVRDGRRFVVAVGGDGTVHEVVNGLVDAETGQARADDLVLGVVAGGSGCDFIRTFGLDRSPEVAARHLTGDTLFPIDLGRVRYVDREGAERVRVFANIAETGYGGTATDLANRLPRFLGPVRYLVAAIGAVRSFDLVRSVVTIDHTEVDEPLSNVVVANCQFFGGGMKAAPRALPDDGLFNVQCWQGTTRDVFLMTRKLRSGEHLGSGDVREYQSSTVRVVTDEPLTLEADGEVLGTTPAEFDVLEQVISLKV